MFRFSAVIVLVFGLGLASASMGAERKPNVIVLLADDLGYADVGFQGCRDIPTPNIDALAAGGVRCTNGYVSGPYCSPTRAGLLTGRYQERFGHEFNPAPGSKTATPTTAIGLPLSETTFADRMRAAGYATGAVGKWHLGAARKFQPQRRGFDEYFGFLGGAHVYAPGMLNIVFPGIQRTPAPREAPIFRGTEAVDEREYLTDAFAREAIAFIDRHKEQPFFLYLAFNAVHTPMNATDARLKKFDSVSDPARRTYCAMTLALDEAIGKVIAKLRATNLEEHTLIFFCSDNGGPTVPRAALNASRNTPLRGSKVSTLEGGIRVPFVVSWKGKLPAGKVYDHPAIQLDFLPTALAAAGVERQAEWKLDGVNLVPFLTGENPGQPHEVLYWRLGPQLAIRDGDWKLVKYLYEFAAEKPKSPTGPLSPLRLYDLSHDIGEQHDLASSRPDKVSELKGLWSKWNATLATPLWQPQVSSTRD